MRRFKNKKHYWSLHVAYQVSASPGSGSGMGSGWLFIWLLARLAFRFSFALALVAGGWWVHSGGWWLVVGGWLSCWLLLMLLLAGWRASRGAVKLKIF